MFNCLTTRVYKYIHDMTEEAIHTCPYGVNTKLSIFKVDKKAEKKYQDAKRIHYISPQS